MKSARIGTYARFSTDYQRPTSIEDQQRTVLDRLKRLGYDVTDCRHFADSAVSGASEKTQKRAQLAAFLAAWDAREFDVVAVDEVSRLARGPRELADIQDRITRTGVHFVTADGLDSRDSHFNLTFGITAAVASHALEEIRHRVKRSMRGQLERGFMIATPPLGYRLERVVGPDGRAVGTRWHIDEGQAAIVREIYAMRMRGASLAQIAAELNRRGVPTPRPARGKMRYWRPGTVFQLLKNPIYKGIAVWNGSAFARAKAKKRNRVLTPEAYARPELRIVDDDTWQACNPVTRPWRRGGGRSPFAGIVRCGLCDGLLTVNHQKKRTQLYCAQCAQAVRVKARKSHLGYASTEGLQAVLVMAIEEVVSPPVIETFKNRLRERLTGGVEAELREARQELARIDSVKKRLIAFLDAVDSRDEDLLERFKGNLAKRQSLEIRIAELERRAEASNAHAIEAQLSADPKTLVGRLFCSGFAPERLRTVLSAIFPRIVLLGKRCRGSATYEVDVSPGVILASVSESRVIDSTTTRMRFEVTVERRHKPVRWIATRLPRESERALENEVA